MILHCGIFSFVTVARATSTWRLLLFPAQRFGLKHLYSHIHYLHQSSPLWIPSWAYFWSVLVVFLSKQRTRCCPSPPVFCCLTGAEMAQLCSCCPNSAQPGSCPFPSLPVAQPLLRPLAGANITWQSKCIHTWLLPCKPLPMGGQREVAKLSVIGPERGRARWENVMRNTWVE